MKINITNCILIANLVFVSAARGADIVWTNTAGGDWTNALNWSSHQLPGAADRAWITNDGIYTVTLRSNVVSIASLMLGGNSGTQTLLHTSGGLKISGNSTGSVHGVYILTNVSATIDLQPGLGGNFIFYHAGQLNWSGGTLGGTNSNSDPNANVRIIVSGGLTIGPGGRSMQHLTLTNAGPASCLGGTCVNAYGGCLFDNASGATLDINPADNLPIFGNGSAMTIRNDGYILKRGSSTPSLGGSSGSPTITNRGTIEIQGGRLEIGVNGGLTSEGYIYLDGGALGHVLPLRIVGGTLWGTNPPDPNIGGLYFGHLTNDAGTVVGARGFQGLEDSTPGILTVQNGSATTLGDYLQTDNGQLYILIGGRAPGTGHSQLRVGNANLSGYLNLIFVNGFIPAAGDTFLIITNGSRSGTFIDTYNNFSALATTTLEYSPTGVVVRVVSTNALPVIAPIPNQTIPVNQPWSQQLSATDDTTPTNSLVWSKLEGPSGLTISSSGLVQWTPLFTGFARVWVQVCDTNYACPYTHFDITVTGDNNNRPPVISQGINNVGTFEPGQVLDSTMFPFIASDPDTNTLTYSLIGAPQSMLIDSANGHISWRIPAASGGTSNFFQVRVTDNGVPSLSATGAAFVVVVSPVRSIVLRPLGYTNGLFSLSVTSNPSHIIINEDFNSYAFQTIAPSSGLASTPPLQVLNNLPGFDPPDSDQMYAELITSSNFTFNGTKTLDLNSIVAQYSFILSAETIVRLTFDYGVDSGTRAVNYRFLDSNDSVVFSSTTQLAINSSADSGFVGLGHGAFRLQFASTAYDNFRGAQLDNIRLTSFRGSYPQDYSYLDFVLEQGDLASAFQPILTNKAANGGVIYLPLTNTLAAPFPARFYRVRLSP